jgi:hypothetical protein
MSSWADLAIRVREPGQEAGTSRVRKIEKRDELDDKLAQREFVGHLLDRREARQPDRMTGLNDTTRQPIGLAGGPFACCRICDLPRVAALVVRRNLE